MPNHALADRLTRRRDCGLMSVVVLGIMMLGWSAAQGGVTPDESTEFVVVDGDGRSHIEHSPEDDRWSHCFALPRAYWQEFNLCIMREDALLERERLAPRPVFNPLREVPR